MTCPGAGNTVVPAGTLPITVSGNDLMTRLACADGTILNVTATGSGSLRPGPEASVAPHRAGYLLHLGFRANFRDIYAELERHAHGVRRRQVGRMWDLGRLHYELLRDIASR